MRVSSSSHLLCETCWQIQTHQQRQDSATQQIFQALQPATVHGHAPLLMLWCSVREGQRTLSSCSSSATPPVDVPSDPAAPEDANESTEWRPTPSCSCSRAFAARSLRTSCCSWSRSETSVSTCSHHDNDCALSQKGARVRKVLLKGENSCVWFCIQALHIANEQSLKKPKLSTTALTRC
jgi:hypothetical protein